MNRSLLALTIAIALLPTACQEPDRAPDAPRIIKNIYGLSIVLDLRDASGAEEFYTVDTDGMLGFGGGMDARFERTSYTAVLDAADMQRLAEIVTKHRLVDQRLESTNLPEGVRYRVRIRNDDGSVNRTIKGENPRIEALRAVLREFANRRLFPELERQPKPSIRQESPPVDNR